MEGDKIKKISFFLLTFFVFVNSNAQPIFFPNNIGGLKLWLSGDSCKSSVFPSIDTVYDLSSNQNHANQQINSLKPKFGINLLNGHKTILFDGNDEYISFNDISDTRTVFWVLKESNLVTPNNRPLLGHSSLYDFHRGGGNVLFSNTLANPFITSGQTQLNSASINPTIQSLPNNYNIISLVSTGNVSAEFFSKDRANAGRAWDGELVELIIYNQPLTNSEVAQVEQYLYDKYAPPIQLPLDFTTTLLCDSVIRPINPNNNQYTYQWSTGATTSTISVNKSGKYWVNAINIFGKLSSDTISVNYPQIGTIRDTSFCIGNSLTWNTNLPKSQYTFQWQDSSPDSIFTITQSGKYYVKITDSFGCSITSDTAKITIDNFSIIASLGPDDSLCAGNSITLTSGASPALTYTWSNGSTNDSLLINITGQYFVAVTNTNSCVARDTINVTVQGFAPTANFLTSITCINSLVSFTNTSSPPFGNTLDSTIWNFGDPTSAINTSTLTNPSHTYTSTGTYTVNLKVKTDADCEQSITKTITVYPVPTATFVSGSSCQNSNTAFVNQSTATSGYSITSSYWNFGDATSSNLTSPNHIFSNFTTYTVKLVVTNNAGCKDSVYKPVFVNAEVKASFTNGPACLNNPTLFQSTSIIPPVGTSTYSWNIAGSYANTMAPTKTFTNSGVYNVTLVVDGNNGCTSSIAKLVNVYIPPISNFSIPSFCSKDTITTINLSLPQSGVISSYNWRLNNTSFSAVQSPTLSATVPGNYSVRLTVANSFGCKDSITKSFTVYPLPVVDFTTNPSAFYYLNEPVTFIPSITNAASYLWTMTGVTTSTLQSPIEVFNSEGSYTVSLNLKDQLGCRNSKTKTITVSKRRLDLAILNVTTLKDNDGFMTVVADLVNYGSVPISSFKIDYQISDGGNIKETWNGALNPNSFYVYTFNASSASAQNNSNNITCVELEKINGIMDDNTTNNSMCNALNTSNISVSNPIPNPTDGDIVLPITLNKNLDYTIAIYNSVGQIQYEETTQKGIEGLNFVKLNTSSYARGCYIIKVMIDGKVFIKKFIKISYE